jgi:exopolysaccharide biosynthesis polyprenyl glycosylphosphotransferase
MATSRTSDVTAAVAVDHNANGSTATVATLPVPLPIDAERAPVARPGDARGWRIRRLLLGADVAALCAAFACTQIVFGSFRSTEIPLLLLSIPLWVLLAYGHQLYHLDTYRADYRASDELGPVLQMATLWSWITLLALPLVGSLVGSNDVPLVRFALFWALTVLLLTSFRSLARGFARSRSWYVQDALVVGPTDQAEIIVRRIERHPEWGINASAFVNYVIDEQPGEEHPAAPLDMTSLPREDVQLISLVSRLGVDRVMLAPAVSESRRRASVICELGDLGVHVDLIPSWSDTVGARLQVHEMEGLPLLTVPRAGIGKTSLRLKRALDLVAGAIALVVLAPVLAACAIAIKLDSPGPVLFRQRRIGRDDEPFELFKFRSMCDGADREKQEVAKLNYHGGGTESGMFKIRSDPRITRVGAFLRRYSLDELPQLFNILRGQMSFVGPRPLIETEDRQVEGRFRRRLGITPGLTGLWQVNGRSEIPFDEMVSLDYLYATNWSLWGDVKLLMRTVSAVLRARGAY